MKNVVSTFPLLRLPIDAILHTFRSMDYPQIYGISILSKRTKNLVESLKLKTSCLKVHVTYVFDLFLNFPNSPSLHFNLYFIKDAESIQELGTPDEILINSENEWTNSLSVKQLLDHLKFIFHTSIDILSFDEDCQLFSLESVQKNVKDIKSICLTSENHEHNKRVLSVYQPATLDLFDDAVEDGHVPEYISIQNFDGIRSRYVRITLNDLLVNNSRSISLISENGLSTEIPNRFMKLWTKGSNPRLEYLHLRFRQADFQVEELLNGLEYQHFPLTQIGLFKTSGIEERKWIYGGWDFWRVDGTKATISIMMTGGYVFFELFVWHEHCVVNWL